MGEAAEVVKRIHQRFNERDEEGFVGLCSKRIVWTEIPEVPGSGKYQGPEEARGWALEAARRATEILEERHELGISVLVGQVRSAAVDLLRSTGMDQASALQALEDAAGRASEIG